MSSFLAVLLNIAYYGAALFLALTICFLIATPFIDLAGGETSIPVSFSVEPRRVTVTAPSLGVSSAQIEDAHGVLGFAPAGRSAFVSVAAGLALGLVVTVWVLGELRGLFRTLRDGQPFAPENANRLRHIAWAIVGGEILGASLGFLSDLYVMRHFSSPGLRFDAWPRIDFVTIVLGLIILVIAEVFKAGTRLDEDQSLTI